jgi:membrane-associated protease RseP (regulator of RpoE activity)
MNTTALPLRKARGSIVAAVAALIGLAAFTPGASAKMSKAILSDADGGIISGGSPTTRQGIKIETIEDDSGKKPAKEVAWLGISTDEACDVIAAQLGLKPGEGLVVIYVEPNSPAAKAGLQKYDVLVEMGDQLLVHPSQLRKLVRRQREGDTIKLSLYRGAKKQSATATLSKMIDRADATEGTMHGMQLQLSEPKIAEALRGNINGGLHEALSHARYDKSVNIDVERSMEEARQALHQALMRNGGLTWVMGPDGTNLEAFARSGVEVGKGTTVTVKKNAKSAKSIAKADETGTYVIVANPKKRLTVHDNEGKLLFDGEIETTEQQQKVPAEIWSKAKSMLDEMGPAKGENSEPEARTPDDENSETTPHARG